MATRKQKGIGIAIIGLVGSLGGAYLKYGDRLWHSPIHYSGRVVNATTAQIVPNIQLTVDTVPPQVCQVGSDGVFLVKLPAGTVGVNIRVETPGYEVFNRTVAVDRTGLEPVSLKPVAPPTSSAGLTFAGNPSLEEIRYTVAKAKHVGITYTNKKCQQAATTAIVMMEGAQLDGPNAQDFLENARDRTKLKFVVKIVKEGSSYEIACQ